MLNNTKNKEHGNLYPNPRQRLHELTASKKINVFIKNIGKTGPGHHFFRHVKKDDFQT